MLVQLMEAKESNRKVSCKRYELHRMRKADE